VALNTANDAPTEIEPEETAWKTAGLEIVALVLPTAATVPINESMAPPWI